MRTGACARHGFALPLAVLVLALITAAVIAGYSTTSAEVVSNSSMRAQQRAYQLAEVGLQQFLLRRNEYGFCSHCVPDPAVADSEWTRVSLSGGYADVVAIRIRGRFPDGTPALFLVRSRGTDTAVRLSGAGATTGATRTVAQYATFGTSSVKPLGAWTSLNGFQNAIQGSRVPVVGADGCNPFNIRPGLVVPSGGNYQGNATPPTGAPPVDSSMSRDSLKKRVGIDWEAIVNENAIPADVTIPPGYWPSFADPNYWPVIRLKRSYSVPGNGRGLIIADSHVVFQDPDTWNGIILVGGSLFMTGSGSLNEVVVSGLNHLLGTGASPYRDYAEEFKRIQFSSCNALTAAARLKTYYVWTNTWLDNVVSW
ncbi:MAG TPA: hypothetical protein VEB19_14790 [Gemmatimonadaceae bacterium]|nr:hypothetical protein [Gemmatimonadaceae bacterium]